MDDDDDDDDYENEKKKKQDEIVKKKKTSSYWIQCEFCLRKITNTKPINIHIYNIRNKERRH